MVAFEASKSRSSPPGPIDLATLGNWADGWPVKPSQMKASAHLGPIA
jgi:hypothetical protein